MSDLISRQDAIDAIDGLPNCYNGFSDSYDKSYIIGVLEELPSAEPRCIANIHLSQEQLDEAFEKVKSDILSVKPKTGKWRDIDSETYTWMIRCSECGYIRSMMSTQGAYPNYCENCGAKMEGEEDGQNTV